MRLRGPARVEVWCSRAEHGGCSGNAGDPRRVRAPTLQKRGGPVYLSLPGPVAAMVGVPAAVLLLGEPPRKGLRLARFSSYWAWRSSPAEGGSRDGGPRPNGRLNVALVQTYLTLSPANRLSVEPNLRFFWRVVDADGICGRTGSPLRASRGAGNDIGWEAAGSQRYPASRHLSFHLYAGRFFAGKYLQENGSGQNPSYVAAGTAFRF